MKKILALLLLSSLSVFGQTIVRPITITSPSLSSNQVYLIASTVLSNSPSSTITQFVQNVTFETNVTFNAGAVFNSLVQILSNITLGGKAIFTNVVIVNQLSFSTNLASTNVLVLNCSKQFVKASHDISYSGFSIPAEYGVSNVAWASVIITNDSANAFIRAFFPGCIGDTNLFITNQSAFTVERNILYGTNVVANNLK